MRIQLLILLLSLTAHAAAQDFPAPEQVRAWAGFSANFSLAAHPIRADDEKTAGTFVVGVRYTSDKTRYAYSIKLFARDSYLREQREKIFAMVKKLQETYPEASESSDIGFHKTSKGLSFFTLPSFGGPGATLNAAFASTKQFDVVVEQDTNDSRPPLVVPSNSFAQFVEAALGFFTPHADGTP